MNETDELDLDTAPQQRGHTKYFVATSAGQVIGPHDEKALVQLVTAGVVNVDDRCTREGVENWQLLGTTVPAVWTSPRAKLRVAGASAPSDRRILPAFVLCLLLGGLGVHQFYLGSKIGIIYPPLLWAGLIGWHRDNGFLGALILLGILLIIDLICIVTGGTKDTQGRKVTQWT